MAHAEATLVAGGFVKEFAGRLERAGGANRIRLDKGLWVLPYPPPVFASVADALGLETAMEFLGEIGMEDILQHENKLTAAALNALGAIHVDAPVDQIVVDEKNKVVSTPAYMLGPSIAPVSAGIEKLVAAILEMA
jgi:hypothetical protein